VNQSEATVWDRFSAEVSPSRIVLRYQNLLGRPLSVTMTDFGGARDDDAWRVPAAYQYLEPSFPDRPFAIIKVVAGPGVSVSLDRFPPLPYEPRPQLPLVEIIRVQDRDMVPGIGYDFNSHHLLGEYEENLGQRVVPAVSSDPFDQSHKLLAPIDWISVVPLNNGVLLRHHWSRQDLIITVPTCVQDPRFLGYKPDLSNGDAKFFFQVNPGGQIGPGSRKDWLPVVEVVKTPGARVEVALQPKEYSLTKRGVSASSTDIFWQIYEVDKISQVPNPGEPIGNLRKSAKRVSVDGVTQPIVVSPALSMLDMAVRFVPAVGDVVDLLEFTNAVFTGRDLFGRKLSTSDLLMMGMGALLPYAAAGAGRGADLVGGRMRRAFGRKVSKARPLLKQMTRAISADEAKLIRDVRRRIEAGQHITGPELQKYVDILTKMRGTPPTVDMLLNVDGSGFVHAELQAAYRDYRATVDKPAGPRQWAMGKTRNRKARGVLFGFLGHDFIRKAKTQRLATRQVNLFEVPADAKLSGDEAKSILTKIFSRPGRHVDRLENLLKRAVRGLDPEVVLRGSTRNATVDQGLFSSIKGLVVEILSHENKMRTLKALAKEHKYRHARIYSGVMIRLKDKSGKLGPPVQCTDDIIAYQVGDNLQIVRVFEAKSGFRGGAEGTEQAFEWIEGRMTHAEGSVLVLPKGSEMTLADGTVRVRKIERTFVYDPGATPTHHVVGFNAAARTLITAQGKSHLGINSADQIAVTLAREDVGISAAGVEEISKRLVRHKLKAPDDSDIFVSLIEHLDDVSSTQVDWLVARILGTIAKLPAAPSDE
jgi:hypothetical protein